MMKITFTLFAVATVFVCGNGRLVLEEGVSFGKYDQVDDLEFDADSDVETRDVDANISFYDESFENAIDENFGEPNSAYDKVLEEDGLEGCHNGKCELCLKLWKLKACITMETTSQGIKMSFKAFGQNVSRVIETNKSFTLKVKRNSFPKFLRKLMKSDLEMKISGVNIAKKTICFQLKMKVKYLGTLRWPKRHPHCFKL